MQPVSTSVLYTTSGGGWGGHWWLSGIHSELPIKGLGVQGQPVVIWGGSLVAEWNSL